MREIKFRAWLKHENKMVDVKGLEILPNGITVWDNLDEDRVYLPSDVELMQFAGLKDKNGKEIYEGDICERIWADDDKLRFKVVFADARFGEWWEGIDENRIADGSTMRSGRVEVIGNIHENPELLKESK